MAHFGLLWKARTIEKYRQNYENEKMNSIIMSRSDMADETLFQKFKHYKHDMQKRLSRTFSKWYPEGSTVSNFFVNLRTDMKLPSILLRGFYGFVGGLCLTYLGFMFFVFQLSLSVMNATVLSSVLGVLVTIGLTFSDRMRCLIFLLAPQLFSRVGRYTLTCYALVLILTGPATNTLRNCEVLSTSMACTQERIKLSVKQINDSIKKPFNTIKSSLKITITSMKIVVGKLKNALIRINRLILSMASVIESNFKWFIYVADVCNDAVGSPHDKCSSIMKENQKTIKTRKSDHMPRKHVKKSTKDYLRDLLHAFGIKNVKSQAKDEVEFTFGSYKNIKSSPIMKSRQETKDSFTKRDSNDRGSETEENQKSNEQPWFLNKNELHRAVCASLKSYEKFFVPADFAEATYVATIRKKLKTFVSRLSDLLHANLNIQHTYTFVGNSSTSGHVACGVVTEIKSRADPILTWLSWSSCVTSLFLLLIIFRAKHYQRMFETRPRFDNRFITKEFRQLDLKRLREGRETVLPLNMRERAKYVTTTSFRLVASEKLHLNRSAVFMTVTTFKLMIHIVADYSLYWVLTTIRYHGIRQTPIQPAPTNTGSSITGSGFVSRLLQSFIDTMNGELLFAQPAKSCLPNPYPPDIKRYCQIGFLIVLLWFFALFEPYGLRLRHHIMGLYRSQRARDRAAWLYNHILRTRATFMKYARRKLHREYKYSTHRHMTLHRWLQSHNIIRWLCLCVGMETRGDTRCLLCNATEDKTNDNMEMIRCEVPNCPGNYCPSCFGDIGQLCTICLSPSDYGDFSDASLEIGSSDDDEYNRDDSDCKRDSNRKHERDSDHGGFQNESYLMEEQIRDENCSTSRISKRKYYSLGRKEENSETIPLLKHSENQRKYSYTNEAAQKDNKVKEYRHLCLFLCRNIQDIIDNKENNKSKDLCPTPKLQNTSSFNITQYSMYEITQNPFSIMRHEYSSEFGKYLRRNKLIRRKKYVLNETTFWEKIRNTTVREYVKKNGSDDDGPKGTKNKSRKITKKHAPNIDSKDIYSDSLTYCIETKQERPTTKVRKEKTKGNLAFTNCWKNIKLMLFSAIKANNRRYETPIKNHSHKRKKKRKKVINISRSSSIGAKLRKKGNFIGNSRLFAYLDERDWVKKYESDIDLPPEVPLVLKDDNIVVNNIMIPRLQLDVSAESINEQEIRDIFQNPAVSKVEGKTYSKCAIGKFIKSIICSSCEFLLFENSSLDKQRNNDEHSEDEQCKEVEVAKKPQASSAQIKYDTHLLPQSAANAKPVSSPEERNYNFNVKRTLSNPLSLIKSIYSSLSLSKLENNLKTTRAAESPMKEVIINHHKHADDNPKIRPIDNMLKTNKMKPKTLKSNVTKSVMLKPDITKTEELKSNLKTENKKPHRAVIFIKEDVESEVKRVAPKKKIRKIESRRIQTELSLMIANTNDKGVNVCPAMVSCACQNVCRKQKTEDLAVQVTARIQKQGKVVCQGLDAESMTCHNATCTCAVQCYKSYKEVGTCPSQCLALAGRSLVCNDVGILITDRMGYEAKQEIQSPDSSTTDTMLSESDVTKTDTTVCSLASVDYRLPQQNRHEPRKRYKVKVVTKSNRSTTTEKTHHCDVSTATYDWWSPIVEKKTLNQEKNVVDRKKKEYDLQKLRERKTFRSKGIMAGDKTVTFRSKTQFIPSRHYGYGDIMSPSRYLLESQKYYNELFYNIFTSPRIYPIANIQKFHQKDREKSQTTSSQKRRKGRKTKRLEDSYTPRKTFQPSPWMVKVEKPENLRKNKRV